MVTKGGKMREKETDCKSIVLHTDSPNNAAALARSYFKDTSRRRVKNDSNGNVPNKAESLKRQTSTSGESSCGSTELTDGRSSSSWSSIDCSKSHSKENLQHSSENIIPEVSEADEDAANTSKVYRGETKTISTTRRRKRLRKRRNLNKIIDTWVKQGHHCFKICQLGGEIELPFCTARFPKNAVKERKTLRFWLKVKLESDVKVLVHPIHCSTANQIGAISFNRSVNFKIKIEQDLYQILQDTEEAELQTTECSVNINWITLKKITIKKAEGYISFAITRFAGFRVMGRNLPLAEKRTLFYAICLKRPDGISDPSRHYFCILIHSAEDSMNAKAKNVFDSENVEIVLPQQSILVRPPCRLEVSVTNENFDSKPVFFEIENPCQNLLKTEHMQLSKKNFIFNHKEILQLNYTVSVSGDSNSKGAQRWFPLQWATPNPKGAQRWLLPQWDTSDGKQSTVYASAPERTASVTERTASAPARFTDSNVTINISNSSIGRLHVTAPNGD